MMKKLILARHGRAENLAESDRARRLTGEGRSAVAKLAAMLQQNDLIPEAIWYSTAKRAAETEQLISEKLGIAENAAVGFAEFYSCDVPEILTFLRHNELGVDTLLAVGHNPVWSALAEELSGCEFALQPAQAAVLKFETASWAEIAAENCREAFKL